MAASSSLAYNYDVFLSFRGQDTRYGFTGHLYKALDAKGIHTFFDEEELRSGEEIIPVLDNAIQESRIAVIVLSKNYASSTFCLEELSTIMHRAESKGLLVLPVFYKVDPSDVRHLRGSYEDVLAKHERRFPENKLQKWKMALSKVADLFSYHLKYGDAYDEYKVIESIVDRVSQKINFPRPLHVADHPVGLESPVAEVMKLLDIGCEDSVHIIGIHGMGGVGKSTLARAVYNNLISHNFDGLCYLENLREKSNKNGSEYLQNMLLQEILKDKSITVTNWRQGASMIAQRLQRKKVLLLLDDVDKLEQLEAIVGCPDWFGPGSIIIITTRDQQLLSCHQVKTRYELKELNKQDALQLFTWKAFKKEKADSTYEEVLDRALTCASGLPLALEVIGSNLYGRNIEDWKSAMNRYKRIPNTQILDILKISFDTLQEVEKSVFLDIVCCFKGYGLQEVDVILSALYDGSMKYYIDVLVNKSLIEVTKNGTIKVKDLIQDMGRRIELEKSHKQPEKCKRLWMPKHIIEVLKKNKGTSKIEIIHLDDPILDNGEIIEWDGNAFKKMKNLKILTIKNCKFSEGPKFLPNSLRVLEWWGYPSNCLPSNFQPPKFVSCKLPHGYLTSFELDRSSKMFENLTVLRFDKCKSLTQIPDLSDFSNLEKLSFEYCDNLVTVHESIGRLGKVKEISVLGCRNLVSFPSIHLTSLEELDLSETGLESFPEILGKMENIRSLHLKETPIKDLPISFVNLVGLQNFSMYECGSVKLPSSIFMMPELTRIEGVCWKGMKWVEDEENEETMGSIVPSEVHYLSLSRCNLDDDFFSIGFTRFAHVGYLDLSGNNFTFLPECIKKFQYLWFLDVSDCKHLQEIRGVPQNIEYFKATNCKSLTFSSISMFINEELYEAGMRECCLPGTWIPEWFNHQSRGPSSSFWVRNKFPQKILCFLVVLVEYELLSDFPAPMVFINGEVHEVRFHSYQNTVRMEMDYTYLFELHLKYDMFEVPLENEWNHVEITYVGVIDTSIVKASGIHVVKQERISEDIRFFNPYKKIKPSGNDVFLSFRGSDTLHGFTGYLHKALHESGIHTYINDEELQRGEKITPAIVKAIEDSRIAITVLSLNYASSSFCLDELAFILDCHKRKRLSVLPVFYNVDPSHVRHQTGSYGEALVKHEKEFKHNREKLQKWKSSLRQVANLPGFHFKHGDGYEYQFIGRIVERVCSEINHSPLHVGYPVGLEPKVLEVRKLLDVGCDGVIMIGIFGTGGVGKSTLTREVYNSIADHFDASCFIENVREKSKKYGLQHLQAILLSKILGEKDITLTSLEQGISMIQHRLKPKKVLLILDDVDMQEQLQEVVGRPDWFGPGSRVIITTQDKQLLASHEVKLIYEVKKLHEKDALQLLKWKAFKTQQYFHSSYEQILNRVVTYASGLPLALEMIGSNLFVKSVQELINQFEESPDDPIKVIFDTSFGALKEKTRNIFLDMACCFKGYELEEIQDILHAHYGHSVKDDIDALVDRSLVKLTHGTKPCYDTITLHDLIEDMGKEFEQQKSERRRLWLLEDIREVVGYNMGTSQIEMICLDFSIFDEEKRVEWDGKAFQNMQNLKTIFIRNVNFSKGPEYLPNSLRVLEWWRYPSKCLPSDFHPKELAICKLPDSHILSTELNDLWKKFPNLKVLEFSSANV